VEFTPEPPSEPAGIVEFTPETSEEPAEIVEFIPEPLSEAESGVSDEADSGQGGSVLQAVLIIAAVLIAGFVVQFILRKRIHRGR
jgi:hypothetical protein